MNSLIAKTYLKTKLCMNMSLTNEVMTIFGRFFLLILANILVAMATSLDQSRNQYQIEQQYQPQP